MEFELDTKIVINVESSNLSEITIAFLKSLAPIFEAMVSMIMLHYQEKYSKNGKITELLNLESGCSWHWKCKKGYRGITIKSLFGKIYLPNPVVLIKQKDGKNYKKVIGRKLLAISPYAQIPDFMKQMIGTLGSLMSFRNVAKSMGVFSIFRISLGSIWQSLQWTASRLAISHLPQTSKQDVILEADGTGISTLKSGKRGSEAKILMQRKEGGGLHFLGVSVGKYGLKEDWESLFSSMKALFDNTKKYILVADGDQTIMDVYKNATLKSYAFFQRCLWHIPHQIKYMLWKDKATKEERKEILKLTYSAFLLNKSISFEELSDYTSMKLARIENLIERCKKLGFNTCSTFLQNTKTHAFVLGRSVKDNHNTSLIERAMRSIKQRTRYATWNDKSVQNLIKVRLNHFYNDKDVGLHFYT